MECLMERLMYGARRLVFAQWLLALAALAACASPEMRIKDNPGVFSGLTPQQQELVRKGQIGLGMPEDAVKLALGAPDAVTEHVDANGVQHIWHYTESLATAPAITYPGLYGPWGWPYAPWTSGPFGRYGPAPGSYPVEVERDRMRVIFTGGRVSAIERELTH
jgi:hypothetical protein